MHAETQSRAAVRKAAAQIGVLAERFGRAGRVGSSITIQAERETKVFSGRRAEASRLDQLRHAANEQLSISGPPSTNFASSSIRKDSGP